VAYFEVLLPIWRKSGKRRRGRPPEDNRNIINGILCGGAQGRAPWRDAPAKCGELALDLRAGACCT
jgi:transposase